MKKLLILILVAILTAGCSEKRLTKLPENSTIVAFGDSLTFGYGAPADKSYPSVLEKITNTNVINEGISGNTTAEGLKRIEQVLEEHKPELIIIGLGGNDMLRKVPQAQLVDNLNKILVKAKNKGVQVVLLATPKPSVFGLVMDLEDADFYADIAKMNNVPLIEDVYSEPLSDEKLKSDPIHLNSQGYEIVAQTIANFLKKEGAI